MERPNHLHAAGQTNSSKVTGLVIVIAIHVLAISGLIAALNSASIMNKIKDIQASVEAQKTPPKAPPPPPPDLEKPPPPIAIVPEFTVETAPPPPPVTTVAKPPPPVVRAAPPPPPTDLRPIMRTHTLPPYPTISQRLGEQGTTTMEVAIAIEGNVTDCKVTKSSGSERLDQAACEFVKAHWRWQPPTQEGKPVAVNTSVAVKWDLRDAQ